MISDSGMNLGTVVRVQTFGGLFWHYGVISQLPPFGEPMIISGSARRGCVVEEPLSQFAQGKTVFVDGYPGLLAPMQVVMRAKLAIGQPWNLFSSNCEHFVRWFHGLSPKSVQVNQTITAALGLALVCAIHSRNA